MPVGEYIVAFTLHGEQDDDRTKLEARLRALGAKRIRNMETMWIIRHKHDQSPGPTAVRISKAIRKSINKNRQQFSLTLS